MKKIVIIPVFCETHLIKYQIQNIIDTINPDYIIYNEGMFPTGPESNTNVSNDFLKKYTLDGGGKRGFDYLELKKIIKQSQKKHKGVDIILNEMNYNSTSAPENYTYACSNFKELGITVNEGDYIFPLEGDVFHHENSKEEIQGYMNQIEPNQGFRSKWIDFVGNQFYAEKSTLKPFIYKDIEGSNEGWAEQGRSRKICIRFGNMDFYKNELLNFQKQQYPNLYPTDLITYHYAWLRPDKYKMMRFDQLNRHPKYWHHFKVGLDILNDFKYLDVDFRPVNGLSKDSTYRYVRFYDIEHPKHIMKHSEYVQLSDDIRKSILKNKLVFTQ